MTFKIHCTIIFFISALAFSFWIHLLSLSGEGGNKVLKDPVLVYSKTKQLVYLFRNKDWNFEFGNIITEHLYNLIPQVIDCQTELLFTFNTKTVQDNMTFACRNTLFSNKIMYCI